MRQILNLSRISACRSLLSAMALAGALAAIPAVSHAQNQVYSEDFETDHTSDGTFKVNFVGGNSLVSLYYDYSALGIPLAPHSTNANTHALKMSTGFATNSPRTTTEVFPTGVSVSPTTFGITDNFIMHWDMWYNFNGPAPGGGNGSTIVSGGGYGTYGTNSEVAGNTVDCIIIGDTGDGGSSADFRVYSQTHPSSYQDLDYQIGSDGVAQTTHGDPTSGYVYAGYIRNNTGAGTSNYYATNFLGQPVPTAQAVLYPQQTGTAAAGTLAFKWHDVSLSKVANVITYKVDGITIATVNTVDAGTSGGSNILFNAFDISGSASTDANFTNLNFSLIDNVRITNFANVVSVSTTNVFIVDGSNAPGVFTITRTSSGTPLTVSYTMTGSAVNGVDYVNGSSNALSGTITFSSAATTTNIFVYGVATAVPALTKNIILNVNPSTNYTGAGNATINLVNVANPQLSITNLVTSMYERTNDSATFKVSRLGNTNTASFPINLSFSGTAANGVNFYTNVVATFEPGAATTNIVVYPIEDHVYTGNKTITVSLAPASAGEYTIGTSSSASVTLRDEDTAPETVLWSDNFNTDTSGNWNLIQTASDNVPDYTATFNFDYSAYSIPPSPHGGGDTHGLYLTANKNDSGAAAAAVNAYPIGQSFSGNYALRFDMWLDAVTGSVVTTEYALTGINHSGTKTNWWHSGGITNGATNFDGVWYTIETDNQSAPNYVNYSGPTLTNGNPTALTAGTNASGFGNIFHSTTFPFAGSPAVSYASASTNGYWSDVELSQIGNVITLRINQATILSYSNSTPYTAGDIMLGYLDAFDSVGIPSTFAMFDNVRVVSITGLTITSVTDLGSSIQLDFTFGLNDSPSGFAVQSTADFGTAFADTAATIIQVTPGHYRATVAKSGAVEFYRIRHL